LGSPDWQKIAEFDHEVLKGDTRFPVVVQTEQHKLGRMAIEQLRARGAQVHFSTRIDTVELLESEARVTISGSGWLAHCGRPLPNRRRWQAIDRAQGARN
jgi:hypothetical protein